MIWTGLGGSAVADEVEAEVVLATVGGRLVEIGRAAGVIIYCGDVSQLGKVDTNGLLASGGVKGLCWLGMGMDRPALTRTFCRLSYSVVSVSILKNS